MLVLMVQLSYHNVVEPGDACCGKDSSGLATLYLYLPLAFNIISYSSTPRIVRLSLNRRERRNGC